MIPLIAQTAMGWPEALVTTVGIVGAAYVLGTLFKKL